MRKYNSGSLNVAFFPKLSALFAKSLTNLVKTIAFFL